MKALAISAQDIRFITLGLVTDEGFALKTFEDVQPDGHLQTIDQFLKTNNVEVRELDAVVVVTGPGSFTASRVSTTIANTISYSQSVPVYGLKNPDHLELSEIIKQVDFNFLPSLDDFATVTYDRPPMITKPKK